MNVALKRVHERESTLSDVVSKYPDVPRLIILKIDVQRRGVHYTRRALDGLDPAVHQLRSAIWCSRDGIYTDTNVPESLLLRDGTSIVVESVSTDKEPYLVDLVDGRPALIDGDEVIEFVEFWEKPRYYDLVTSSGIPMKDVISARPQRLSILLSTVCHFGKNSCLYCEIHNNNKTKGRPVRPKLRMEDVSEVVREALREEGRFCTFCITGGSILKGQEVFDREVDLYIELLQAIGEHFGSRKFPSQLVASAYSEKQLRRLYDTTGLMSYTCDLEVLDPEKFRWICPGKAEAVGGYEVWKQRVIRAVDIFGRGNVSSGIVGGVELATPYGFTTEEEALEATLAEAESLARHGVPAFFVVWVPRPNSPFRDQKSPSLDYYVRLTRGLERIKAAYGITTDFDDYRRCGNHPDTDLSRIR
ncbi:MAG: radical SAM protein [Chlorobiaceae bacterium]|nr:radical SAM protein [Chlorobiaceae bacterium]